MDLWICWQRWQNLKQILRRVLLYGAHQETAQFVGLDCAKHGQHDAFGAKSCVSGFSGGTFFIQMQGSRVHLEWPLLAHARPIEQQAAVGNGGCIRNLDARDIDNACVRGGHAEGCAKAGEKDGAKQGIQRPPEKRRTRGWKNRTVDRMLGHRALVCDFVHGADGAVGALVVRFFYKNQTRES